MLITQEALVVDRCYMQQLLIAELTDNDLS